MRVRSQCSTPQGTESQEIRFIMLFLPFWGICAFSLLTIFYPMVKELHEPTVAMLRSATVASKQCVKLIRGRSSSETSSSSSSDASAEWSSSLLLTTTFTADGTPTIVNIPSSTVETQLDLAWNGGYDYILIPTESSLATQTQPSDTLWLMSRFTAPPRRASTLFPSLVSSPLTSPHAPPSSKRPTIQGEGESEVNEPIETDSSLPYRVSNDGLPFIIGMVSVVLFGFHVVVFGPILYDSGKRKNSNSAKKTRNGNKKKAQTSQMEEIGKVSLVFGDEKKKPSSMSMQGIILQETTSSAVATAAVAEVDPMQMQMNILEHIYIENGLFTDPQLVSVKRWTMPRLEFEKTYLGCTSANVSSDDLRPLLSSPRSPSIATSVRQQLKLYKRLRGPRNDSPLRPGLSQKRASAKPRRSTIQRPSGSVCEIARTEIPSINDDDRNNNDDAGVDAHLARPSVDNVEHQYDHDAPPELEHDLEQSSTVVEELEVEGPPMCQQDSREMLAQEAPAPTPAPAPAAVDICAEGAPVVETEEVDSAASAGVDETESKGSDAGDLLSVVSGEDDGYESASSVVTAVRVSSVTSMGPASAAAEASATPAPTEAAATPIQVGESPISEATPPSTRQR